MKKVLSLVLVLTLVLGSLTAFAAPASDVVGTDYEAAVERLSQLGVLTGYPDGTFKPNNTITRAEFAAAVVRVKGLESAALAAKGNTAFTDVPVGHWASGYVNIATKAGLVKGMGDGTFAPNAPVTYEQAVTMVMRALNYEATAEARGGYPYGYLIVANENDLLDAVKGVQGLPAVRGLVAQLLDNALEIPMMIQVGVGFNSQPLWVKSGTQNTEEVNLLDDLGFTKVARDRVVSFDSTKNEIRFEKHGKAKVDKGFDFEEAYGLRLNAWLDGNGKVVVYTKADTPKFDATSGGTKIKLVNENKSYVVSDKATLLLNGEDVSATGFTADYAKVVLNADDEIIWARGYTFDDTFVAKKTGEEVIYSFDNDDLIVKGYTIVKEGKTIALEDVEEGDLVFFNKVKKYAVIHNDSQVGEIERVYDLSFKFNGETYDYDAGNYDVKFVDEDVVDVVDKDIMSAMKDEGKVEVFFDFAGKAVLVLGDRGETKTNYFYAVVANQTVNYQTRGDWYWTFDVLNEEGKVVKYDLTNTFVTTATKYVGPTWNTTNIDKDVVVKVTVDDKGAIVKVENLGAGVTINEDVKVDAEYVKGYKLQADTIVFLANAAAVKDYKVMKWEDADKSFSIVKGDAANKVFAGEKGRAGVLFVKVTDVKSTNHVGLVTDVRKVNSTSNIWDITIELKGEEKSFLTDGTLNLTGVNLVDKMVQITLTDKDKISAATVVTDARLQSGLVSAVSTSSKSVTVGSSVYELVDGAVVYDATNNFKQINLRDLNENDTVSVYRLDTVTTRFINYVVRTAKASTTPIVSGYTLTYSAAELTVGLKTGDVEGQFAVLIGTDAYAISSGKVDLTALNAGGSAKIYTAKLVKITDPSNVLASETFIK